MAQDLQNMKNKRRRIREGLLEALAELVMTLIFGGIGFLILHLFGVDLSFQDSDPDLIVLVGVGVFFAVLIAAYAAWKLILKIKKRGVKNEADENRKDSL